MTHGLPTLGRFAVFVASAVVAGPAWAEVHVIDPLSGAGTDFVDLASAVQAAQDGDILLLRTGDYLESVVVDGKALTLIGDAGSAVTLASLRVTHLASGQFTLVKNLSLTGPLTSMDNAGALWVEDCSIEGSGGLQGLGAIRSDALVLSRCTVTSPLRPMDLIESNVHLFDSSVVAPDRPPALQGDGDPGSLAIRMEDSQLTISGGVVRGGDGAAGAWFFVCGSGGDGGAAVVMEGSASQLRLLDAELEPGEGGPPSRIGVGDCAAGERGEEIVELGGVVQRFSGASRQASMASPVREGSVYSESYSGDRRSAIYLALGASAWRPFFFPGLEGALMVLPPLEVLQRPPLSMSGVLATQSIAPQLPPGSEGRVFVLQSLFVSSSPFQARLGAPVTLVVLDESF